MAAAVALVPRRVAARVAGGSAPPALPLARAMHAAVLFVDISGFTRLSEAFSREVSHWTPFMALLSAFHLKCLLVLPLLSSSSSSSSYSFFLILFLLSSCLSQTISLI